MKIREFDIAVVGGGPAGLFSALYSVEESNKIILFDSRDEIGSHEHCAGLLSVEGLTSLKLPNIPKSVIQNDQVIGSKIYSPSGKNVVVEKQEVTAWVVNRSLFEKYLQTLVENKGVAIESASRVQEITRKKDLLQLKLGKNRSSEKIIAKLAILAEGRFPRLNKQVGLHPPRRDKIVFTSQYMMKNIQDLNPQYVELYQDSKFAPGFFAWIIPITDTTAKVGLGSKIKPSHNFLSNFISQHPIAKNKLKNAVITKKMSGAIPLGSYIRKTYTDNIMVVGDAAGQTKPTTGGGVILGGKAAQFAGIVAKASIKNKDYSKKFLSQYEKFWKKEMKNNLTVMKLVRSYINSLDSRNIEKLFNFMKDESITRKISALGDVDNQKRIVFHLLFEYRLWPFLFCSGLKWLLKREVKKS